MLISGVENTGVVKGVDATVGVLVGHVCGVGCIFFGFFFFPAFFPDDEDSPLFV